MEWHRVAELCIGAFHVVRFAVPSFVRPAIMLMTIPVFYPSLLFNSDFRIKLLPLLPALLGVIAASSSLFDSRKHKFTLHEPCRKLLLD